MADGCIVAIVNEQESIGRGLDDSHIRRAAPVANRSEVTPLPAAAIQTEHDVQPGTPKGAREHAVGHETEVGVHAVTV